MMMSQKLSQATDISTVELIEAKEAANDLLEQLGLDAYLFEIEPRDERWELRIDCAIEQGWQSARLPVDKSLLLASHKESGARERLLSEWRTRLAACTKCNASR
jgi:hypothetical protein